MTASAISAGWRSGWITSRTSGPTRSGCCRSIESPLRDDGYDISDYKAINPAYGTLDEFRDFVEQAHARDIKIITELVVNHSSDQHPWFQRARRAPPGSPERDYYVWSDTGHEYEEARIIFIDSEVSNWTWDPVAKAYYWHRFYACQPDLNFDNPLVVREIKDILNFWLDLGVDGFRLDAVPYLVEREGTTGENLRETHNVLKMIRAEVERRRPECVLLAEANQPPEIDAALFRQGRRVPHGVPLPADAAAVHGRWRRRIRRRSSTSSSKPATCPTAVSGRCSCATTTN